MTVGRFGEVPLKVRVEVPVAVRLTGVEPLNIRVPEPPARLKAEVLAALALVVVIVPSTSTIPPFKRNEALSVLPPPVLL